MKELRNLLVIFSLGAGLYWSALHQSTISGWLGQASDQIFGHLDQKENAIKAKQDSNERVERAIGDK